jgi:hypothetical protein
VTLKSVSFDAKKMIAKYDFPEGEGGLVVLAATFDGNSVTGTWSLREKATDNEITTGGWTAKRK